LTFLLFEITACDILDLKVWNSSCHKLCCRNAWMQDSMCWLSVVYGLCCWSADCWCAPYMMYTEGYFVAMSNAIYEALRVRSGCYLIF